MITRRLATSLFGALPFAGPRTARSLLQGAPDRPPSYPPPSGVGQSPANPIEPRMKRWQAYAEVMRSPMLRDIARSAAWRRHRYVHAVDPDIEVYRSFSPMAKIAFQRQRNVEREMASFLEPDVDDEMEPVRSFVQTLVWGPS